MSHLRWYQNNMGANSSKLDTGLTPVAQHQQTKSNSIDSVPSEDTILSSRRLPPVQSRETVRSEAARISGWRLVNASDQLYESTITSIAGISKRVPIRHAGEENSDLPAQPLQLHLPKGGAVWSTGPHLVQPSLTETLTKPTAKRQTPVEPEPRRKKKKRLLPTAEAVQIASVDFDSPTEPMLSPSKIARLPHRLDMGADPQSSQYITDTSLNLPSLNPFAAPATGTSQVGVKPTCSSLYQDDEDSTFVDDFSDEGYGSLTLSPSDGRELTEEEKGEKLIKMLARFRRSNISLSRSTAGDKAATSSPESDPDDVEVLKFMLKDQEASAERSRILRERALERRRLQESNKASAPNLELMQQDHNLSSSTANSDDESSILDRSPASVDPEPCSDDLFGCPKHIMSPHSPTELVNSGSVQYVHLLHGVEESH